MEKKGYKKLIVWQKADELAYKVYIATEAFPRNEIYGMVSQLRRAVVSVPANLVEGSARQNKAEMRQFANIALGSLAEAEYLLSFALRLKYLRKEQHGLLQSLCEEVGKLLWRFYKSF